MAGPSAEPGEVDSPDAEGPRCPACGGGLYTRHCKYVCPRHGVVFDCSDPFY